MKKLSNIILSLKSNEVQYVKTYLKTKLANNTSKRIKLYDFVSKSKSIDNEAAASHIYKKKPDSAFSHLKKKLREDILDLMMVLPLENTTVSNDEIQELTCQKLLLQSKILKARGVHEESIALAKRAAEIAEKYELPNMLINAYDQLYSYELSELLITDHAYYELLNQSLEKYKFFIEARDQSSSAKFSEGGAFNDNHGCLKRTLFWNELKKVETSYQQHKMDQAWSLASELSAKCRQKELICTNDELLLLNLKKVKIQLHRGAFNSSLDQLNEINTDLLVESPYYQEVLQTCFYVHFNLNNYQRAQIICKKLLEYSSCNPLTYLFQAALHFRLEENKEVTKYIHKAETFKSKNAQLSIALKWLELINILELKDYDWFEFRFDTFRKKLFSVNREQNQRWYALYDVLRTLRREDYNYQKALKLEETKLTNLHCDHNELRWIPQGLEVIDIAQWFVSKATLKKERKTFLRTERHYQFN